MKKSRHQLNEMMQNEAKRKSDEVDITTHSWSACDREDSGIYQGPTGPFARSTQRYRPLHRYKSFHAECGRAVSARGMSLRNQKTTTHSLAQLYNEAKHLPSQLLLSLDLREIAFLESKINNLP